MLHSSARTTPLQLNQNKLPRGTQPGKTGTAAYMGHMPNIHVNGPHMVTERESKKNWHRVYIA